MTDPVSTAIDAPRLALGAIEPAYQAAVERARSEEWVTRLWDRDTTLWSDDARVQATIADRLGWLDAPAHFALQAAALEGFGDGAREAGFDTAVVMGMGGSSLAPDVFHRTFGTTADYLDLRILDSTDPAAVASTVDDLDPLETLWIVASKSGTTTEPLAFLADAWARVEAELAARGSDQRPGEFFAAITDPEKSLEAIPHHDDLRERFLNPPDVGGRYSALTYVGLVPASLIGVDVDSLLAAGAEMLAHAQRHAQHHAARGQRVAGDPVDEAAQFGFQRRHVELVADILEPVVQARIRLRVVGPDNA
jgi:glucose-6-phosphate isomerase